MTAIPSRVPGAASVWIAAVVAAAGCAGPQAEAPLRVRLGTPRAQARTELRAAQFCPQAADGPAPRVETYPRCPRSGSEWSQAWVTARYDKDALVELRRYERFTDDGRAMERWNELVTARRQHAPESAEAAAVLSPRGELQPGTRTFKAFRVDADTVVGVFLLTPQPPEDASILELVVRAPAAQ